MTKQLKIGGPGDMVNAQLEMRRAPTTDIDYGNDYGVETRCHPHRRRLRHLTGYWKRRWDSMSKRKREELRNGVMAERVTWMAP
jgi:hypothetical protein